MLRGAPVSSSSREFAMGTFLRRSAAAGAVVALLAAASASPAPAAGPDDPQTVHVFHRTPVRFAPDSAGLPPPLAASDEGREVTRAVTLPEFEPARRIIARITLHPVPKDAASVHDKWDRAGNVVLVRDGEPDVEIVKFITAYGGRTTHEVDVTRLAPLLRGDVRIRAFVDTWVTPAWKIDVSLTYEPVDPGERQPWMDEWLDEDRGAPDWCVPVAYEAITRERMDRGDLVSAVTVPEGTSHVELHYLVSGHCTDGSGADEFVSKDNVIRVDGSEVHRFRPWRDDCRSFRDVNPYCRRWFDGSWSADFSRSGWCPGDVVEPVILDLTETMPPGEHDVAIRVEDVRPKDENGHGVWRVSATLVGWTDDAP